LRNARDRYMRWGAVGKVQQLDEIYAHLRDREVTPAPTSTMTEPSNISISRPS
jgi:hypothetical protein